MLTTPELQSVEQHFLDFRSKFIFVALIQYIFLS